MTNCSRRRLLRAALVRSSGFWSVQLTFEFGTVINSGARSAPEKLRDVTLPTASPSGRCQRPSANCTGIHLRARHGPMELREARDWFVEPRFLQVPGVADVTPFGGLVKQYQMRSIPWRSPNTTCPSARSPTGHRRTTERRRRAARQQAAVDGHPRRRPDPEPSDIENIVVSEAKGVPVFVRDIGRVTVGAAPQTGIFGVNREDRRRGRHRPDAAGREPDPKCCKAIKEAVDELNRATAAGRADRPDL